MVGGMTSAVLLTLIVLPVIYSIVKKPELNAFNKELSKAELKSNA
jgi:Cu(I)/Ag(I) efflux system membrane protein CusA/SilA